MLYYAGIGSRETPPEVLSLFAIVSKYLSQKGLCLRSGGANGADKAFEAGCDIVNGQKEIYLPWRSFEKSNSELFNITNDAMIMAEKYHPYWSNLSVGGRKLQARNCYQVLGYDLKTPSSFVICWTKNGSGSGGTGQAIRIAKSYDIPIFDAGKFSDIELVKTELKKILKERLLKS